MINQTYSFKVEKLAKKEKEIQAQRGWFGFLWGAPQQNEVQELNTAAAISK